MVTITVCVGSSCHLKGSNDVVQAFSGEIAARGLEDRVTLKASFCMDDCVNGVCVAVNDKRLRHVNRINARDVFEAEVLPLL